ncbi:hypothetical protein DPEC_G00099770 [Dallia pectoralis]|uniref:Uncharacterized protein n=1 Tax=Dallia pectoralis TaxID=75939 RepID=A0ACC2GX27_DALPE|nr:hypothetical protein DPEC_G00099770 [Dallia pectoralis]
MQPANEFTKPRFGGLHGAVANPNLNVVRKVVQAPVRTTSPVSSAPSSPASAPPCPGLCEDHHRCYLLPDHS